MTQEFTKGVTARVSDSMFDELDALAKKEQRPMSNMVRVLITEALHYRKMGLNVHDVSQYLESKNEAIHPQAGLDSAVQAIKRQKK